jgi:hypothetical protein
VTKLQQSLSKTFRNNFMHFSMLGLIVVFAHGTANAAWTQLDPDSGNTDLRRYIDLGSVRQAGPMAIYRQVSELTVYAVRLESGAMSILRTSEYDCMNARIRVLTEAGFRSPGADGEAASIPPGYRRQGDWYALTTDLADEAVWSLLCPGGDQR